MRRDAFGEPLPATIDEIALLMDELGLSPATAQAEIFDSRTEEAPFTGWTAEISDSVTGGSRFSTCGFPDGAGLMDALGDIGIQLFIEP